MNTKPEIEILTWCNYARIKDQCMVIVDAASYHLVEKLPDNFNKFIAFRCSFPEKQTKTELFFSFHKSGANHENKTWTKVPLDFDVTPHNKYVYQTCIAINMILTETAYELEVSWEDESTIIATLPLLVVLSTKKI